MPPKTAPAFEGISLGGFEIPKLDRTNWTTFRALFGHLLLVRSLARVAEYVLSRKGDVSGGLPATSASTASQSAAAAAAGATVEDLSKEEDSMALSLLVLHVDASLLSVVVAHTSFKAAWEELERTLGTSGDLRIRELLAKLLNLHFRTAETVVEYLMRAKGMANELRSLAHDYPERQLVLDVVRGLPKKFEGAKQSFLTQISTGGSVSLLVVEQALVAIESEYNRNYDTTKKNAAIVPALAAGREDNNNHKGKGKKGGKPAGLCHICEQGRHYHSECPYKDIVREAIAKAIKAQPEEEVAVATAKIMPAY